MDLRYSMMNIRSEVLNIKKNHACLFVEKDILKKKACIVVYNCDKMSQFVEENKALKKAFIVVYAC